VECVEGQNVVLPIVMSFKLSNISTFSRSACVGRDVDTSMFLRTVASPETLNG
jgi:hypothetical protein